MAEELLEESHSHTSERGERQQPTIERETPAEVVNLGPLAILNTCAERITDIDATLALTEAFTLDTRAILEQQGSYELGPISLPGGQDLINNVTLGKDGKEEDGMLEGFLDGAARAVQEIGLVASGVDARVAGDVVDAQREADKLKKELADNSTTPNAPEPPTENQDTSRDTSIALIKQRGASRDA